MIELTTEQHASVAEGRESPLRVIDPVTRIRYVLLPEEMYDRVVRVVESDDDLAGDLAPHVLRIFGRDGWDDPAMDVYDDLDPRRP